MPKLVMRAVSPTVQFAGRELGPEENCLVIFFD